MKDSGIEWIGEMPEAWSIHRIKNNFSIISGSGFKTDYQGEEIGDFPVCKASDISAAGHKLFSAANYISQDIQSQEGFSVIPAGSVLFAKIGEAMKKNNRTLLMVNACADNNCQAMVPQNILPEYAYYLFSCIDMQWFDNAGTIPCINNTKLLNFKFAYPQHNEQVSIVNYLDQKCADIDAIISAKEKTNELLKERRQSIIYEAVTKGLDPTVPMKDSGIEWIGDIPESWNAKKIKYSFALLAGATPKSAIDEYWNGEITWITPADYTTDDKYVYGGHKTITEEGLNSCATTIVPEGSIIFSKRAPIGLVAINKVPLCTNQGCISCVPNSDVDSEFYYYAMSAFTKEFDLLGSGTTFKEISAENFANFVLPNPDFEEQKTISNYLNEKCAEINTLIEANNSTIEKLKKYRQSVIYEAVTGKVEI